MIAHPSPLGVAHPAGQNRRDFDFRGTDQIEKEIAFDRKVAIAFEQSPAPFREHPGESGDERKDLRRLT